MKKKEMAEVIRLREYYLNGFNRLSGRHVRVSKVRVLNDRVLADIFFIDDETQNYEFYKDCEYPLDLFDKTKEE